MELRALLHPYTDLLRQEETGPLVICRAEGARIFDETGKDYIEGMGGLWCASLGFSEKRIVDAIRKQLDELPFYHLFAGKAHRPAIELAGRLPSQSNRAASPKRSLKSS